MSDKLSILWTQEQRFIFDKGESEPPIKFIWDEKEYTLDNSLLDVIEADKLRGIGYTEL